MKKLFLILFLASNFVAHTFTIKTSSFRWRNDNGTETSATWKAATDAPITLTSRNQNIRLRLNIYSGSSSILPYQFPHKIVYYSKNGGAMVLITNDTSKDFILSSSSLVSNETTTTNQLPITNYSYVNGYFVSEVSSSTISNILLSPSSSTEVEYCILATDAASDATTYTFYPDITDTTYANQAASLTTQFCGAPSAVAQTFLGSKTVADLVATGTALKWYDVATNGTALASTTVIATGSYYVSQTLNSCESDRTTVSVTVTLISIPDAPTNLEVIPFSTGGMIQFTAPTSDGGSVITNYEYSTDNGSTWITPSPAITSSPLNISSGLTNCTSYQVKIRAVNAAGSGTESAVVTLVPSTSNIGVNWTSRTSVADEWNTITYGNDLFVAVASGVNGNRVMTSPDGITWTGQTSAADNSWSSVTYGNGLFVAVANNGDSGNRVMTSSDGITWTARTSAADNAWRSVTYGNGIFVAVAFSGNGNRVMTSLDGITWTSRTSAADNGWRSVAFGNGLFVAVANTGENNRVMTSPDGITWTARTSAADNEWFGVTYGNGLFVAVAQTGTNNRVMTSDDGITWTIRTSAADIKWRSVTYGNGLFMAVANSGTGSRVMTSPDGITWTARTSAADNAWNSVTYGNGVFVAVANNIGIVNLVMTSSFSPVADKPVITSASVNETTATVSFTQSTPALAPAITNYRYSIDNGSNWTTLSPSSTTSPITITGLTTLPNSILISAVNSVGSSCPSNNFCLPPTATAQTLCGSKTVADLVATGTDLKWYDVATNGSALATTTAIASGTYYVTQTLNSSESERTSVAVTVNPSAITSSAIKLSNASIFVTNLSSLSNWSISGGLDQGLFSISNNTMLNFNSVANYNSTSSNVYLVNVSSGCTNRNLTITISPLCGKWD
jgi:hypothetical protein